MSDPSGIRHCDPRGAASPPVDGRTIRSCSVTTSRRKHREPPAGRDLAACLHWIVRGSALFV